MSDAGLADWDDLAAWWMAEVDTDPMYADDVYPLVFGLLGEVDGSVLDVGCGEGQGMRLHGGDVVGCDLSGSLLARARRAGPVVRCRLPGLEWARSDAFAAAFSVFVLDLVPDMNGFFAEVGRVVESGGALVVLVNHPIFTAPGAGPLLDDEGETLWRWGRYFDVGTEREPAGDGFVTFHHRPMGRLLNVAASAGWILEAIEEHGLSPAAIEREPAYSGQETIPRMLAARWRRA